MQVHVSGLIALSLALAAGPALAEPTVLKFSMDIPSTGSTLNDFIKPWAAKIEQESKGTVKIELYPNGALSKIGDTLDRVANGVAEIGWETPASLGARLASFGVASIPGIYEDAESASVAMYKAHEKGIVGAEMKNEKVKILITYLTPPVAFYLKQEPKGVADFGGLKLAMSSKVRAMVTQQAGGIPVAMAPPQYYQSLQKGVIDGIMTSLAAIIATKTNEVLDYYERGPFGGGVTLIVINSAVYDKLPPEAKKAIDDNSGAFGSGWVARANAEFEEGQWTKTIQSDKKNKVVTLDAAGKAAWAKGFDVVKADWLSSVPDAQKVYDGYKAELEALAKAKK